METNKNRQDANTQNSQANPTLEDRIGGKEKAQEIKNKIENADGEDITQTVVRSSEVEDENYPKEPEIVTNKKFTYGD